MPKGWKTQSRLLQFRECTWPYVLQKVEGFFYLHAYSWIDTFSGSISIRVVLFPLERPLLFCIVIPIIVAVVVLAIHLWADPHHGVWLHLFRFPCFLLLLCRLLCRLGRANPSHNGGWWTWRPSIHLGGQLGLSLESLSFGWQSPANLSVARPIRTVTHQNRRCTYTH